MRDFNVYCCYLLQSISKPNSFYIGSTPNPVRRLRQHNGDVTGGARKTQIQGKRPWKMICLVWGFQSSIAALQFEHAWQNPHRTRHIETDKRISRSKTAAGIDKHIGNLKLLLNAPAFIKWPLNVHLLDEITVTAWTKNKHKLDIPDHVIVELDLRVDDDINSVGAGKFHEKVDQLNETRRQLLAEKLHHNRQNDSCSCPSCKQTKSLIEWAQCQLENEISPLPPALIVCPECNTKIPWMMISCQMNIDDAND